MRLSSHSELHFPTLAFTDSQFRGSRLLSHTPSPLLRRPLPIFWSLYDQQSSRWIFQAQLMNLEIFPGYSVTPDQVQVGEGTLRMLQSENAVSKYSAQLSPFLISLCLKASFLFAELLLFASQVINPLLIIVLVPIFEK